MNLRKLVGHKVIRTQPVVSGDVGYSPFLGIRSNERKDYDFCNLSDCVEVVGIVDDVVMIESVFNLGSPKVRGLDCRFDDDNWKAVDEAWEYVYGNKEKEAELEKPMIYQFDRITRESFSAADLAVHDFKLKEIVYVPHGDKQMAFRVEHVTDEKAYLVAVDCVGRARMTDMNEYLDKFIKELPEDLLDICGEIEHKVNGQLIRKAKCYWEDTPYDYEDWDEDSSVSGSTYFLNVYTYGYPGHSHGASISNGVCPCLSILRKNKKDNSEEQDLKSKQLDFEDQKDLRQLV